MLLLLLLLPLALLFEYVRTYVRTRTSFSISIISFRQSSSLRSTVLAGKKKEEEEEEGRRKAGFKLRKGTGAGDVKEERKRLKIYALNYVRTDSTHLLKKKDFRKKQQ